MQYLGGKFRIMKPIAEIINNYLNNIPEEERNFVSLFLGAGYVEQLIKCKKILNDKHPYLMAMYKDLANGRVFPSEISEEEYKYCREHKDDDPGLAGFVGFGCSFGGKWWGGYARDSRKTTSFAQTAINSFNKLKERGFFINSTFTCLDYREVPIKNGSVVYCDPPYADVTKFDEKLLGDFDHDEFWRYMRKISKNNIVLISELKAPEDFECIWQKSRQLDMKDKNNQRQVKIEKLFKYKG